MIKQHTYAAACVSDHVILRCRFHVWQIRKQTSIREGEIPPVSPEPSGEKQRLYSHAESRMACRAGSWLSASAASHTVCNLQRRTGRKRSAVMPSGFQRRIGCNQNQIRFWPVTPPREVIHTQSLFLRSCRGNNAADVRSASTCRLTDFCASERWKAPAPCLSMTSPTSVKRRCEGARAVANAWPWSPIGNSLRAHLQKVRLTFPAGMSDRLGGRASYSTLN